MRRFCIFVALTLALLVIGRPLSIMSSEAGSPEPGSLIVVTYGNWDGLQRLSRLGLNVLDLQDSVLAAIVTPHELDAIRDAGFAVRILESPAMPGQYYLMAPGPRAEGAPLTGYGQVFPYTARLFILKADPAEAELLSGKGFLLKALAGPIVLPSVPPVSKAEVSPPVIQVYSPLIQNLVSAVSQSALHDTIQELQKGSRYTYSPQLPGKRDYIRNQLQAQGLSVQYQNFTYGGTSLSNIEGTLGGWGPGSDVVYIVCAHYDSRSEDPYNAAPGADDNASGTAAVIEAARVLAPYRFKHTLRFVTFPAEEQGIIGSQRYAAAARSAGTRIEGVVNNDMIAWDSNGDTAMDIHVSTRRNCQPLANAFLNSISTYGISLVPQYVTQNAETFSDHSSFWNQNYPAILVIEDMSDFNTNYHTTGDTLDTLDLPYARKFVQTTVATLADLAEIIPPGVRVEHTGPTTVLTDTQATLTVKYSNPGPNLASNVRISDALSTGLTFVDDSSGFPTTHPASDTVVWQVGDVVSHTQSSFVITASVSAVLPPGAHLTSTVDIAGVTSWDDPGDNQALWTGFVPHSSTWYFPILLKNNP